MKNMLRFFLLLILLILLSSCQLSQVQVNSVVNASEQNKEQNEEVISQPNESQVASQTSESSIENQYICVEEKAISSINNELFLNNEPLNEFHSQQVFPDDYTDVKGVITFRGSPLRNSAVFGKSNIEDKKLNILWSQNTLASSWGGGAGWTGQPSIIKWDNDIKQMMNIKDVFKEKDDFVEVIYGSLDGNIYFMDLETGEQSRAPINIHNPIKGSLSIDPRGYPLLYVGQGIPETDEIGFRIFSLINGELLYFIDGKDSLAFRKWGAFDSSPIINRETDTMILGGENGFLYHVKLNTVFDKNNKEIHVSPEIIKYRYIMDGNKRMGIENSVAVYRNLAFFADNDGYIQAINLMTMKPIWVFDTLDDTDASLVLEIKDHIPYIYTGTEVDLQGEEGNSYLRKLNGLTGEVLWERKFPCYYFSAPGEKTINGGLFATPVAGKESISNLVIFTIARYGGKESGLMIALEKETGKEVWKWEMPYYSWSSPTDFYDSKGNAYIIQADFHGDMYLLDAKNGERLDKVHLGKNIEASPAIFDDTIVVGVRGNKIYGVKIK